MSSDIHDPQIKASDKAKIYGVGYISAGKLVSSIRLKARHSLIIKGLASRVYYD